MKKLFFLLSTLALILALVPAGMTQAKKPAPKLDCTMDYWWVRDTPGEDPPPFPGHWEGAIYGDIGGELGLPVVWPGGEMRFAGQTSHYAGTEAFTIYDRDPADPGAVVLMVGDTKTGSTTVRHGKNSNWRTSGKVTDAGPGFEDWMDRKVYQAGTFTWAEDGAPKDGSGTFRVN